MKFIFINQGPGTLIKILLKDIVYIEAIGDYCKICTPYSTYSLHRTLAHIREAISINDKFVRIHRSYIVNVDFIKHIENHIVYLHDEKTVECIKSVPIGDTFSKSFYEQIIVIS